MNKRIVLASIALLALAGAAFAQAWGGPMMGRGGYGPGAPLAAPPAVKTIEGKLQIVDGVPALVVKDLTYLLHFPGFFRSAYIDGIKEGTTIKAEGYEYPAPAGQTRPFFVANKLTVGSKTYDLATQFQNMPHGGGLMGGYGMMGRRGGRW